MTNYQIGDFLIRLKNASLAGLKDVTFPKTKMAVAVAKCLEKEGFLESVDVEDKKIIVKLAIYNKKPVISDIKIVSKPGLRIYINVDAIESYRKPEVLILTTPKGVISNTEAKKMRIGGELIAKVL